MTPLEKGNNADRNKLAHAWQEGRRAEKEQFFMESRSDFDYAADLKGYRYLFEYLRTLSSQEVLDIGVGRGYALKNFPFNRFAQGLRFKGTNLRRNKHWVELGIENEVMVAGAEKMEGVASASVGCVLSVFSITYSRFQDVVASEIARILVPGGVIKAVFNAYDLPSSRGSRPQTSTHHLFVQTLKEQGFDVCVDESDKMSSVVLGVKPGNLSPISAEELMQVDGTSVKEQIDILDQDRKHSLRPLV